MVGRLMLTWKPWMVESINMTFIIHEQNFVDPNDDDIHTQNVENMWMRVKRKFKRQFGTSRELYPTYLAEFMWRNRFRNENHFLWKC